MDADSLNLLGHQLMTQGQIDQALEVFKKAITANPLLPQSHYNLGVCYMARGQYNLAITNYKKALSLSPDNTVILNNIGVTYGKMDKPNFALKYYKMALKFEPDNIFALSNIGAIYVNSNPQKAKGYLKKAIKINPHLSDAAFNLGICLGNLGDMNSIKYFEKAIKLEPSYSPTYGHLHYQLRKICDWKKASELEKTINTINENNIKDGVLPAQTPFESVVFNDNLKTNFDIARVWSRYIGSQEAKKPYPFTPKKASEKIRIGFLSADFNNHATAHLILGFFNLHNRKKFEFFVYSHGTNDESFYRQSFEKITKFRDIRELSNSEAADLIHQDKIDILVDLKGYTQGSRLEIIAGRPAPVIVGWLGFPGTTGANFIDYLITDSVVTPKDHSSYYSENLIFLPHTYQSTNNQQEIAMGMTRSNFGLPASPAGGPQEGFLFCSFNQGYKIDPKTFASWMRILKKVPQSSLCLLGKDELLIKNLKGEAKKAGINPNRLIFLPNLAKNMHLARIACCNLALDTQICNGHTSTTDCLWAGIPVIALLGNHFASRVSGSLLTAIGLTELITKSSAEYEKLAIDLGNNPKKLLSIRYSLLSKRPTYPLFDTARFTKNLERAFCKIWQRHQKGLLPENINIVDKIGNNVYSMTNNNLGVIYLEEKKYQKAISYFQKAISQNNKNALAFNNLGTALKETGKPHEAVENWEKASKLDPTFIEPLSNLGVFYLDTGQVSEAITNFTKLINVNPNDSNSYNNLGLCYLNQNDYQKAIENIKKAVELNPNDYAASYHLGLTYRLVDDYENSVKYLKNALKLNPEHGPSLNIYSLVLMQVCDWKEFIKVSAKIPVENESPYINVARTQNQKINLNVARLRSEQIEKAVADLAPKFTFPKFKKGKRMKIGYLSRDYFEHATAYLILGLFEAHDRKNFEVFAYSYGPNDGSIYRKKLEKDADHFVDILNLGYVEAAKKINADEIDILIDLKGHTKDNRLEILALRPAPIQVSYLGFPGTIGANFVDYVITDRIVTPPSYSKFYTEKFAYMPDCYQINYNKRKIADIEYKRSDFGLPPRSPQGEGVVFSCFNHTSKIDPETFTSWMRILKKVPNSVLWLFGSNSIAEANLKKAAKKAGINPKRLIFTSYLENSLHLARIKLSDLALDTFTYNGHTSTSDSLWAGVPVVTLQGKHFASRVASSILTAAGLPELITHSQKEYEDLAISLALNPDKLNAIRYSLFSKRLSQPLFDTQKFVKNLEKAYQFIWNNYLSGKKPRPFLST